VPVIAVVGGQWGDEGKGKVIDLMAGQADLVVRAQGGDNAGHTVVNDLGEFALHLVPAGIFNPNAVCIIGAGVALNPGSLIRELDALEQRGVATQGLRISERAHLVMPYHVLMDRVQEVRRGANTIGTTGRGIGPTNADKMARTGVRAGDLLDRSHFLDRLRAMVDEKNELLRWWGVEDRISFDEIASVYLEHADRLQPYIRDVTEEVASAVERDATVLLEGAQGSLLDIDFGTFPYVTTSACTVAGLCQGAGVPPRAVTQSIGVYKAYSTRVGDGPMPTELDNPVGEYLREHAHEFGTTTGRARRVGWFDGVAARYTARLNGFDAIALTRLDILDEMESIQVCVAYEVDGRRVDQFPSDPDLLANCRPVYEEHPGWKTSICGVADFEELPDEAVRFVHRLEEIVGTRADIIGVGPARDQTIARAAPGTLASR
jgi:adenylosuccinate synthase